MSTETESIVARIRDVKAEYKSLAAAVSAAEANYQKEAKALTQICEAALERLEVPEWHSLKELNKVRAEKLKAAQERAKELQSELAKLTESL